MRKERKVVAMPTAKGLFTALVVIFGMAIVAYTTVALSGSQQSYSAATQSRSASSSSISSESSLPLVNQTAVATVSVSIPPGSGNAVQVSYLPDQIVVVVGVNNTVTWVNDDSAPHTVTANDGSFGSGNVAPTGTYTFTFTKPGTYAYHCLYHPWMVGTVIVKAG